MAFGKIASGALRLLFTLTTLLVLTACGDAYIKKGSWHYPEVNPHPSHHFLLHGTIGEGWDLHFFLVFEATDTMSHVFYQPCGSVTWYNHSMFTADKELVVHRDGPRYSVVVPVDYFQPGRCDWKFHTVEVRGTDQSGRKLDFDSSGMIVLNPLWALRPVDSANSRVSIRCTVVPDLDDKLDSKGTPGSLDCHQVPFVYALWFPQTTDVTVDFPIADKFPLDVEKGSIPP